MSHFRDAHLTVVPTNQSCRIPLNMLTSQSRLPMKHVALFSRVPNIIVMSYRQACRIPVMSISQAYPPIKHVAFLSCPSHNHDDPSSKSHSPHAHLKITPFHQSHDASLLYPPQSHDHPSSMSYFPDADLTAISTNQARRIPLTHM